MNKPVEVFVDLERKEFGFYRFEKNKKQGLVKMKRQSEAAWHLALESDDAQIITPAEWDEIRVKVALRPLVMEGIPYIGCIFFVRRDGLWGILNQEGRVLEQPRFSQIETNALDDALDYHKSINWDLRVSGDVEVVEDGFHGIVHSTGKLIIPPVYDSIVRQNRLYRGYPYGYIVQKEWLYGACNADGKLVVPIEYDSIGVIPDSDDYGLTYRVTKGKLVGIIDVEDGRVILPAEWDDIDRITLYYYGGDQAARGSYYLVCKEQKYGLFDGSRMLIEPIWDEIRELRWKWFADPYGYKVRSGGLWGFCDWQGRMISRPKWDEKSLEEHYMRLCSEAFAQQYEEESTETVSEEDYTHITPESKIEELGLKIRAFTYLKRAKIDTVAQLKNCSEERLRDILKQREFDKIQHILKYLI